MARLHRMALTFFFSEFDSPLLYRLSYEARREQVVGDNQSERQTDRLQNSGRGEAPKVRTRVSVSDGSVDSRA